jgi:hypothetical protein
MVKIAIISPDTYLATVNHLSFHFVLAHRLTASDCQFYRNCHQHGDFIILDNGAPEGALVRDTELIEAANAIRADEVVFPDVLRDADATIKASFSPKIQNAIHFNRRMVVPQGKDWAEWTWCLNQMLKIFEPRTVGVPKWLDELPGGRLEALRILYVPYLKHHFDIHLLGMARAPAVEFAELNFSWVRSMDTALPVALAQCGKYIDDGMKRASMQWDASYTDHIADRNVSQLLQLAQEAPICTSL